MRTSSFPPIYVSTKEESFFLNFFVLRGAKNTSKTCGLTRVRTRVRNTTDTSYEYERETQTWRLYEAIFVESNFTSGLVEKDSFWKIQTKESFVITRVYARISSLSRSKCS